MYKILYWYIKRPHLYPDLVRRIKRKLFQPKLSISSLGRSDAWCKERAKCSEDILTEITGLEQVSNVIDLHRNIFNKAGLKVEKTPVEMAGYQKSDKTQNDIIRKSGGADLNLLYWICEYLNVKRVLETGVAYGWSSLAMLLSIQNRENSVLISNDMPYPGKGNDKFVGCVVPEFLHSKWILLRYADREGIPKAINKLGQIDLCHYDSDKSYEGRMWAYPLLWNALKPGGIFISDDIGDNFAFRDFCNSINRNIFVGVVSSEFNKKYFGLVIKD